jgi:2-oxoglutarate dehydrogenase E1 component
MAAMAKDLAHLGQNLAVIDELYEQYCNDPRSVDPGFRALFEGRTPPARKVPLMPSPAPGTTTPVHEIRAAHGDEAPASLWRLLQAYRAHGHQVANLDPLGLLHQPEVPELEPAFHGFGPDDWHRPLSAVGSKWARGVSLERIVGQLQETYCGSIALEFMHISSPEKKQWLAERMEQTAGVVPNRDLRMAMLEQVVAAETFEHFCHSKFPGTKRFSLEGGEGLRPLLEGVLDHAGRLGTLESVLGMAHRGRLTVLTQIMGRRPRDLFSEFEDIDPESTLGSGDVKYHMGYSHDRVDRDGNEMHLSLTFNPSHLEAVNPVVIGRVRAKQRRYQDDEHKKILGILIHGDAAFAGQGLVAETLQLGSLHGYRSGGTVHVIVNNQIGFTASPSEYRSTPYCTDVAMMVQCPIWHVNGEDLDAVAHVVEMAMEYRAAFHSDVVIDMFCYRKYGHNEMDEPSFTNPLMYKAIQAKKSVATIYSDKLKAEGVVSQETIDGIRAEKRHFLEEELKAGKAAESRPKVSSMKGVWEGYVGGPEDGVPDVDTGVPGEQLAMIAERMTTLPEGFNAHPKVRRLLDTRGEMARGGKPIDWGMAELLAYGSILWEGFGVRLSGQDCSRGTFSHRHAVATDLDTGEEHLTLSALHPDQGRCRIYDSPLSEAGVLGFEFGYSLDRPDALIMWEAQFGDFANGAQVIIDQFIIASEDKWYRLSGLVLLLPHGYEGQGPEHSSSRIERYLQSCAEDNIQVCQPSTPAQMFHLLRRQIHRPWRKPLVVATPKSLLRLPEARSDQSEFVGGRFHRFIGDPSVWADGVHRVLLCSGRVYYDLVRERARRGGEGVAIIRAEQLYPWRPELLKEVCAPFTNAKDVVWVQDEPENMGPWGFLQPKLIEIFGADRVKLVSREASASPATGSSKAHAIEQAAILEAAFGGEFDPE